VFLDECVWIRASGFARASAALCATTTFIRENTDRQFDFTSGTSLAPGGAVGEIAMNTRLRAALVCGVGFFLATAALSAHHSFAAEFDANKPITLRGILTRMDWVNPHGWIYMDVKNAKGVTESWGIEAGAPNAMLRRGLRKADFPAGIEIVVTGFLAKNGTHTANGRTVTLPDGREFFAGSSGTGAPADGAEPRREQ
jgi:hypothetical protein